MTAQDVDELPYTVIGETPPRFDFKEENGTVIITGCCLGTQMRMYSFFRDACWQHKNGCTVDVPETINGLPVTAIADGAFKNLHLLLKVTIPESVHSIGDSAFRDCHDLLGVNIPKRVTRLGSLLFSGCERLQSVNITGDILTIDYGAFFHCERLCSVTLPNSVTAIRHKAFCGCDNLSSITIPANVTEIGEQVFISRRLKEIKVDPNNRVFSDIDGVLYNKNATTLIEYPFGKSTVDFVIPNSVAKIMHSLCGVELGSLSIPDRVTCIDEQQFAGNMKLTTVVCGQGITHIGKDAFNQCSRLKKIYFKGNSPTFDGDLPFGGCDNPTIYYHAGASGWGSTYATCPTTTWKA